MFRTFALFPLLLSMVSYAGGFRISLQGVAQLAKAHTSAHARDASVAFFNPAGISFIPSKLSVATGVFGLSSTTTYQNLRTLQSFDTSNPLGTPFYAAVTYKMTDIVSVGLSVTTPFGNHLVWGKQWDGREVLQELSLKSYFLQPVVSFKLADWVSLGGGYIYSRGQLDWTKSISLLNGGVRLTDDNASGSGFNIGFYFSPDEKWDLSVSYRSPIIINSKKGTAEFDLPNSIATKMNIPDKKDNFTAKLPLVDEYTLGLSYKVTPKWSLSADLNYHGWDRYDELTLKFDRALIKDDGGDQKTEIVPKNFHSTRSLRFGTEYRFSEKIAGRLGYYHDESPYEDNNFNPETPSFDANVFTAGVGIKLGNFGVDLSGSYNFLKSREVSNSFYGMFGQLKGKAYSFGLGLSYNVF